MTADGEPAEIEALERYLEPVVERLNSTAYLDNAREFLEEIAYRRDGGRDVTMVELAVGSRWLNVAPELSDADRRAVVTRLLGDSGVLVAKDGDFQFARDTAREYLAAFHVVRRYSQGPRWWLPRTWRYLAPRPASAAWPWPDAGVAVFVAALWRRLAPGAVDRRLRWLLRDRHLDPNIHLVVELVRRELLPGSDFRNRLVRLLRRGLTGTGLTDGRWVAMVGWLHRLDPRLALDELESVIRTPGPITSRRRLIAPVSGSLGARRDPVRRGELHRHRAHRAGHRAGRPRDRFTRQPRLPGQGRSGGRPAGTYHRRESVHLDLEGLHPGGPESANPA